MKKSANARMPGISTEQSPLLAPSSNSNGNNHEHSQQESTKPSGGTATVGETMTNLAKTCMGTGCLALPYAAQQGGAILYITGIFAIALWNVWASTRLIDAWELAQRQQRQAKEEQQQNAILKTEPSSSQSLQPPDGTATLGKLAWYALGSKGLYALDAATVTLLLGIVVAYEDAVRIFLQATPFTTGSDPMDAVLIACILAPLSLVRNLGYLTKTSAAGLVVLAITLMIIAAFGIYELFFEVEFEEPGIPLPTSAVQDTATSRIAAGIQWFPRSGLRGVSQWFGCCVFGFGVVPLTFNFQESMQQPEKLPRATLDALLWVALFYIVIGLGLLTLYPGVQGDVLSELPTDGILPVLTRITMALVVLVSAPLLIVPCAEIIEGKILPPYEQNPNTMNGSVEANVLASFQKRKRQRLMIKMATRATICLVSTMISVAIPEFVSVLTLVGCFCVATVSFIIPPTLHGVLRSRETSISSALGSGMLDQSPRSQRSQLWVDSAFLLWGLAATAISTVINFRNSIQ